mmetsp:Transcript_4168/g.11881  ORF Transcript_4168/g.11881 Transcript_4168/m.11881 type:complete len:213 (-) Transcript_4168:204-842(-)
MDLLFLLKHAQVDRLHVNPVAVQQGSRIGPVTFRDLQALTLVVLLPEGSWLEHQWEGLVRKHVFLFQSASIGIVDQAGAIERLAPWRRRQRRGWGEVVGIGGAGSQQSVGHRLSSFCCTCVRDSSMEKLGARHELAEEAFQWKNTDAKKSNSLNHRHRVARRVRHDHGDMLRCGIGLNMSAAVLLQPPDRADANLANGAVQRQREVQRLGRE